MNVYDFDKTIYKNDSTADFYFYSLRRHPKVLLYLPALTLGYAKFYIFKKGTKTAFKEKVMKFASCTDLEKDLRDFWSSHKHLIKDYYLKQQREDDVIISASPEFLLRPICDELGIKHLICSRVNPKTGKFTGLNCHGKEKVVRFEELFSKDSVDEFYSDSLSDTPMAEIAKKAFLVKGDKITPWPL